MEFDLKKNTVDNSGSVSNSGSVCNSGSVGIGLNNKSRCILKRKHKVIGGVRYIKKRLEKIISRINLEILTGVFAKDSNNNEIIIDDDKINSILDVK